MEEKRSTGENGARSVVSYKTLEQSEYIGNPLSINEGLNQWIDREVLALSLPYQRSVGPAETKIPGRANHTGEQAD